MDETIMERAITLRKHYQQGVAYANRGEMQKMLYLLIDAKSESVGAHERRMAAEIEHYKALLA